jgi:hypothetical protein
MEHIVMTPEEYIQFRDSVVAIIKPLNESIGKARELAEQCEPPKNRRRATPSDIVEGAIIWHWREDEHGGWYWHEIDEVMHPNDDFKAYTADGCRYGLHEAWVRSS